ncbi:predicted protein [Nematostella vectensis]|uniref:ADP-ribosylation factor-like protein 13B n=1 Tax=Nematostella vectensis TaxID=45351 RepID=A7RV29_NEMVE|nr:predicted protein [Nematostella vectensis]|eukprot:XP_001636738.1 predicted protein [Nematostella vectensis]
MFSLMANCFSWIKWKREPVKKVTILMVGLDNAGKTSTVADLKGEALDGITPTVGFLSSNFNMYRFNVTVYDLGGGAKIRGIWKDYYAEVFGVVFVVDASNRERMDECRSILHETKQNPRVSGKPLLILANKQDLEGAMNDDEVYQSLDLGALIAKHKCPCQVYTCSAYIGQGNKIDKQIKKGFQWLLSEVSSNFASISLRVEKDIAEKKRIDAAEKKAKLERVRKARAERYIFL